MFILSTSDINLECGNLLPLLIAQAYLRCTPERQQAAAIQSAGKIEKTGRPVRTACSGFLFAQTKLVNQRLITVKIGLTEVGQHTASLSYQFQ